MFTAIKKLVCKFTDAERDERAQLLVSLLIEADEVEEKRKDRNKRFRDQMKDLQKRIRAATAEVRAGGEERDVECRIFFNQPAAGTKQTLRTDTGEVVSEVAMTEAELQENLFKHGELEGLYGSGPAPEVSAQEDELFKDAVKIVVEFGKASTPLLQRRLRIGHGRALSLIETMEKQGIVGPEQGNKSREILKRPDWLDAPPEPPTEASGQPEAGN